MKLNSTLISIVFVISIVGIGITAVGWSVFQYISAVDTGAEMDAAMKAEYNNNENILAAHRRKLAQALSSSKLNASQVESIIEKALEARYGDDGSQATWQWIQENHPQLDQSINIQLMQISEAGENEFKNAQTKLLDVKRQYEVMLAKDYPILGKGWWLEIAGFPKISLDVYKVISSSDAQEAFETGTLEAMEFN